MLGSRGASPSRGGLARADPSQGERRPLSRAPTFTIAWITGMSSEPRSVSAYSTDGGDVGTTVRVINLANSRSVVLTITDRGPFTGGRILDVSEAAARRLGFHRKGVTRVRIEPAR